MFQLSTRFALTLVISAGAAIARPVYALEWFTGGDLFDVDRGGTVTDNSPLVGSIPEALIAQDTPGGEPGNLFFADAPAGTVSFVEFSTGAPVELGGFNLHAAGDTPFFPELRTFDHFKLSAKVNDQFVPIYDGDVVVPYEFVGEPFWVISTAVEPITAQHFRAEFTHHLGSANSGPRVAELDGFPVVYCGDANYSKSISATDALIGLKAAIGSGSCPWCVCNVKSDDDLTASDALAILRGAVGLPASFVCEDCFVPAE